MAQAYPLPSASKAVDFQAPFLAHGLPPFPHKSKKRNTTYYLCLCCICLSSLGNTKYLEAAPKQDQKLLYTHSYIWLGDYYYRKEDYHLAQIEYERFIQSFKRHKSRPNTLLSNTQAKLALSLLRQAQGQDRKQGHHYYKESLALLSGRQYFPHLYLAIYAALVSGHFSLALQKQGEALASKQITQDEKEAILLLSGTVYIETRNYEETRRFYSKLQKESIGKTAAYQSGQILSSLERYEQRPKKNPWIAGLAASLLPGSGHAYAEHYTDAVLAFLFNLAFLGSAIILYDLEQQSGRPHYASAAMGVAGIQFYAANIVGGVQAAHRYNRFQERIFHQELRDSFFHLDYVEKLSKLEFAGPR